MDEGRLELDDDGQVLDAEHVVDLGDPDATEALSASRADAWVSGTLAAWVARHRRPVAAGTAVALVGALGLAWWSSRPAPPPPPLPILVSDAGQGGSTSGGARIDELGDLAVDYAARASGAGPGYDVVGLVGPGIQNSSVAVTGLGGSVVTSDAASRVETRGDVRCDDPAIATARPGDYGLVVRAAGTTGPATTLVPFSGSTTRLDVAVRDHCLTSVLPRQMSVVDARLDPASGTSVVTMRLVVRNTGNVPLTIATQRRTDAGVEVDQSQSATVVGGADALLQTRLLVHDCTTAPRIGSVLDDPSPVTAQGYADPFAAAGIAVQLTVGGQSTTVSYPLPITTAALSRALDSAACRNRPAVRADLVSATGSRAPDGSWYVDGLLKVRTSGIGISVGREHFAGPAWGSGSTLVTGGAMTPSSSWTATPVQLDGGAGHLTVRFTGSTCLSGGGEAPDRLSLQVVDATQTAFPFEVPIDAAALQRAVAQACATFVATSP